MKSGFKYIGVVAVAFTILLGAPQWRRSFYYSSSGTFINPVSGRYDPDLEAWITPLVSESKEGIHVDVGDPMDSNEIKSDAPLVLSALIRMHPRTSRFVVQWEYPTYDTNPSIDKQELIYDRETGNVSYYCTGYDRDVPYNRTEVIATGVTDLAIHRLAQRQGVYGDLGK